jgi:hypothetical protein
VTVTRVTGSVGEIPYRRLVSTRVDATAHPHHQTHRDHAHGPGEHRFPYGRRLRAQRQADADLPGVSGHGVRHHAVDAYEGQEKRHTGECPEQIEGEAPLGQAPDQAGLHGREPGRDVGIEPLQGPA